MRTTNLNTNGKALNGVQVSLMAAMMTAMTLTPLGCTDEGEAGGPDEVSANTGALSGPEEGERSFRQHKRSGRHEGKDGKEGMRGHKHGKRGGRHRDSANTLFKAALGQDSLTDAQRETIESLLTKKRGGPKDVRRGPPEAFRANIVQSLRDGKVDTSLVETRMAEQAKMHKARVAKRAEMLNTLHATLSPAQREAVVAEVKARWERKGEKFKEGRQKGDGFHKGFKKGIKGGPDGDRKGRNMRDKSRRPRGEKGSMGKRGPGGLFGLIRGLDLTEDQQTRIAALNQDMGAGRPDKDQRMARKEANKKCRTSVLDAFAEEGFDAATLSCPKATAKDRTGRMKQHIERLSALIDILTDEQRNQLADRLENPERKSPKEAI